MTSSQFFPKLSSLNLEGLNLVDEERTQSYIIFHLLSFISYQTRENTLLSYFFNPLKSSKQTHSNAMFWLKRWKNISTKYITIKNRRKKKNNVCLILLLEKIVTKFHQLRLQRHCPQTLSKCGWKISLHYYFCTI